MVCYYNDSVMGFIWKLHFPHRSTCRQIDSRVRLKTTTAISNVNNPKSAINFLKQDRNGYLLWLSVPNSEMMGQRKTPCYCSEWKVTIYSYYPLSSVFVTGFRVLQGMYKQNRESATTTGSQCSTDAGLVDYYIDHAQELFTKNPLPSEAQRSLADYRKCVSLCIISDETRRGANKVKLRPGSGGKR